jgi:opacity protein-like surface antigen
MSLIRKLGQVFILAAAGAVSVTAQTQAVDDSSLPIVVTSAVPTSDPKKPEVAKPSNATFESGSFDKTSGIGGDRQSQPDAVANTPTSTTAAPQPTPEDEWNFVFSPYFWAAGLHGETGGPNRTVQVDEPFADIFDTLKFAFMGVFEAHKNRWAIQTDVEFVSLEDDKATPGPLFSGANAKIKTFVFTPEVGYKIYRAPDNRSFVQVLGGTRIWHINADITFNAGILPAVQIENSRSWVDAVVGMRGKAALSEKFFFMGRFDVGGGGSKFTYQWFGGLGYNLTKNVALIGGYRALDVNYDRNNFVYDTDQRGLLMGIGFKF